MSEKDVITIEKRCKLCLGWGMQAPCATYLEWERQLNEVARKFNEEDDRGSARLFKLKMENLQLRLKPCFHCDGAGYRVIKTIEPAE